MNGQNKETKEGFIKGFRHPRKAELATALLSGEATVESLAAAGFGRVNVLEMARTIRHNVAGMEEFNFEWPRDIEVTVAKVAPVAETVAPEAEVPTATPEATPEVVPETTPEAEVPVAPVAEVTPETVKPEATPEAEVPTAEITPEATQG